MDTRGPGEFFARHRVLYAVALLGAASAGAVFAVRAIRSSGPRRVGWTTLAVLQVVQVLGIMNAKAGAADRRAPASWPVT
jgi:hypothetical protein